MRFPLVVCVFVSFAVLTVALFGQSPNGNINGLVSDPTNAAVANADIVAANDVTGIQYTTKTDAEGLYALPNLPPGPYRVQVSKIGFKTLVKPDITLNVQDSLSINFTLLVGAFHEIVTVESGAALVNTESAAVSTVIDQTYVENMPLNGRSFQDLILLTPGIVTQSFQPSNAGPSTGLGMSGEFSVNGQRTESNYYTVDGVSANLGASYGYNMLQGAGPSGSVAASTALGTTQALVSVDALQEFRVQSSTYSAEYGRNPGGQFAFDTKSGTNQWHGTAFDYLRNGVFDAPDYFNDYLRQIDPALRNPAIRQNDFGGTLGGPVEIPRLYNGKDKTFFFVSYEGLRLISPQAALPSYVPDLCLRGVAADCMEGNTSAPVPLNQALNAFPIPNGPDFGDGIAEYIGSWSNPSSIDSTSVRFDHFVNDKLRLFLRLSNTTSSSSTRGQQATSSVPTIDTTSSYTLRTYTAGGTSVFTNHLSNEFRFNYSSNASTSNQLITTFGGSTPVNLVQLAGLNADSSPALVIFYDGYYTQLSQGTQSGAQRQWNLVNTTSLSLARHQLKFGADYRRLAPFAVPPPLSVSYGFTSESAVEANNAVTSLEPIAPAYPLYKNFSAFAQDQWKVSQRLSLSLGLRWEVNPAPGVTQGLKPYTIDFVSSNPNTWTLAPQGTPLWRTTWFNFAPRLGAAYILHETPGWETVIRGGGGVFFDTGQQLGSYGFEGPGFSAASQAPSSFPALPAGGVPSIVNPPTGYQTIVYGFSRHLQLPYTLHWNASIEQALGKSQALTVSYVASHGSRLLQFNQFLTANNPNALLFGVVESGLSSDYDSLQIQFRRRLARGLAALASYTWSHCIDYGSENANFAYQRGNCDFDVRNNLSTAFSYDLPNMGSSSFMSAVVRHWGVDDRFTARTAFPATLLGNFQLQPNGQVYDGGLNLVPGQPVYVYGAACAAIYNNGLACPGGRAINPNAFTAVNSGLGDAARNFARGFGAWQMDMTIRREFPIHERLKLQFRAEAFNVFNHPNLGTINPYLGQPTFGQATATLASSLGILSPLYQQGGNRSMQFALKLIF